jgi:large subunit ribosomal protein L17
MRHSYSGRQFGRSTHDRRALFRNLVTDFLRHGRVQTTAMKAKEIQPIAEGIITLGRGGSIHERRRAAAYLTDYEVVQRVFSEIGPRFKERNGGYTRIVRVGPRKGDGAEVAVLELVQ